MPVIRVIYWKINLWQLCCNFNNLGAERRAHHSIQIGLNFKKSSFRKDTFPLPPGSGLLIRAGSWMTATRQGVGREQSCYATKIHQSEAKTSSNWSKAKEGKTTKTYSRKGIQVPLKGSISFSLNKLWSPPAVCNMFQLHSVVIP